jgi:hypothetical protein
MALPRRKYVQEGQEGVYHWRHNLELAGLLHRRNFLPTAPMKESKSFQGAVSKSRPSSDWELFKSFFQHVGYFFQVEHDFVGCPALLAQITNDQNEGRHAIEIPDGFPTHCFVCMKKHAIGILEAVAVDDGLAKHFPSTLKIRKHGLLISGLFGCKAHWVSFRFDSSLFPSLPIENNRAPQTDSLAVLQPSKLGKEAAVTDFLFLPALAGFSGEDTIPLLLPLLQGSTLAGRAPPSGARTFAPTIDPAFLLQKLVSYARIGKI